MICKYLKRTNNFKRPSYKVATCFLAFFVLPQPLQKLVESLGTIYVIHSEQKFLSVSIPNYMQLDIFLLWHLHSVLLYNEFWACTSRLFN